MAYVYVVRARSGVVKIGSSTRPKKRFQEIASRLKSKVVCILLAQCSNRESAFAIEGRAHHVLRGKALQGQKEYYQIDADIAIRAVRRAFRISNVHMQEVLPDPPKMRGRPKGSLNTKGIFDIKTVFVGLHRTEWQRLDEARAGTDLNRQKAIRRLCERAKPNSLR